MARFSRLHPVNRIKHVVDIQYGQALGVNTVNTLIQARDAPVLANTSEVLTGSIVNGIFLVVETSSTSAGALSNLYLAIWKDPGTNLTAIVPNAVGSNDDKRFVIHQEMVMLQQDAFGNPRTLFKGVVKLPRGYRRFGPNDALKMATLSPGVSANICIQTHYKEFR